MTSPRIVACIQARMGSTRLPGKVLADVCGQPALTRLLKRVRRSKHLTDVVLATSTAPSDDALEVWARAENVACLRGSEDDVLNRIVKAHHMMRSEIAVEVTGDCTLIDPDILDMGIATFLANDCHVVSNTAKLSFPMGADVQVVGVEDLNWVEANVTDPAVREHVTLYFYEHPERYRILHLQAPPRWHGPHLRFQLDYAEDLRFIKEVYKRLEPVHGDSFGVEEVKRLLSQEPELAEINRHCIENSPR